MAPEQLEIVVVPSTFARARSGAITGRIWLRYGRDDRHQAEFPEAGWFDFPVAILGWWLDALSSLTRGGSREVTCRFMDGPFEFTVARVNSALLCVVCFERRGSGRVPVADFTTPTPVFRDAVQRAVETVLDECDRRGWADADVQRARDRNAMLRNKIVQIAAEESGIRSRR